MRPRSISLFHYLMIGIFVVGLVQSSLSMSTLGNTSPGAMTFGVLLVSIVIGYGITLVLWYLIVRHASNAARWIYIVLTLIGLATSLFALRTMMTVQEYGAVQTPLYLVSLVLQAASLVMLFRADARRWFSNKGIVADPQVFE